MRLLLDTHALVWFLDGSDSLSAPAMERMLSQDAEVYVSVASLWEIAIKIALQKLELPGDFEDLFPGSLNNSGLMLLPIEVSHLVALRKLPLLHRDPFDRLIIAQAQAEEMMLVSNDSQFASYGISLIW